MNDLEQMLMQQEGTGPRGAQDQFLPYPDSVGKLTIWKPPPSSGEEPYEP